MKYSGVNFIDMSMRCFLDRRSQKGKKLLELTVFFALLESLRAKAARKLLVELTPIPPSSKNKNIVFFVVINLKRIISNPTSVFK